MNTWILITLIALWLLVTIVTTAIGIHIEIKQFNKGICKRCGGKLKRYRVDRDGLEEWWCESCGNTVWVSWPTGTMEKKGEDEK